jgi:hypothetical protein
MWRRRRYAAVTLAALVFAGCGSAHRSPPTLLEFAERANEICRRLSQQQEAIDVQLAALARSNPAANQALVALMREDAAVSRAADVDVQSLPRPREYVTDIEGLVAGYFEEANYENKIADAYARADVVAERTLDQSLTELTNGDASVAIHIGMTDCAKAWAPAHAS